MNYTAADLIFSTAAFFIFSVILIPPGYALGWILDLFDFRGQPPHVRLLLSLPLSVAMTPILVYLLGLVSFSWLTAVFFGLLLIIFLFTMRVRGMEIGRFAILATLAWFSIAVLSLVDLQIGSHLYFSVVAYDYTFRSAVTGAMTRAATLPANNPFFFFEHAQPFRYHYFWFMMSALPVKLARALDPGTGLSPRHAVIASSAWSGLSLFATLAIYVRFFLRPDPKLVTRITVIAILLVGVSGLDIIPVLSYGIPTLLGHGKTFYAGVDWWNGEQVTNWFSTILWVPHHLASLVACLTGFLILWSAPCFRWQASLGAALAFASATGLSVYVTLVFAVFAFTWTIWLAFQRHRSAVISLAAAGLGSTVLAIPFLAELVRTPSSGGFASFSIRTFDPMGDVLNWAGIENDLLRGLAYVIALPLNYFLEFGFFSVIGFMWLAKRRHTPGPLTRYERASALMLGLSLIFCTFIRSDVAGLNDLGVRGMLPVQFVLVLWGAQFLAERPVLGPLLKATLVVGIATTVYDMALLRADTPLSDNGFIPREWLLYDDPDLGQRTQSTREVYEALRKTLPTSAIVQHNPTEYQDIFAGLYSDRQMVIMDVDTATTFAGKTAGPSIVQKELEDLFTGRRSDPFTVCRELSIDALVVKDLDPVWKDRESWAWKSAPVYRAPAALAIDCRKR